jgi:serine O-acetyltransferase
MFKTIIGDIKAVRQNDPAAKSTIETMLCHTPLHAILMHRVAHFLHKRLHIPIIPRLVSVAAHWWTGVEIHPGATIGNGFFIDHGTGVVIGETAEIGDNCVIFHNVTMGGTGKHHGKRHPTIEDNVFIGTGAVLLGPIRVGRNSKIGANSFIIMHDVPPNCTVVGTPAKIVKRDGEKVDEDLEPTVLSEHSVEVEISNEAAPAPAEQATSTI